MKRVSKQRPSKKSAESDKLSETACQQCRIFKNSYTRNGQRIRLKNWSVKIQHQSQRHTFSLSAKTKKEAVIEARSIYDKILAKGWDTLLRDHQRRRSDIGIFSKNGVRYWKERLLLRRYRFPGSGESDQDLATGIDHNGTQHLFLLGTPDADAAAIKAQNIHRMIAKRGWIAACERFSRELIVGLEWCSNPILWTYTTIHTLLAKGAGADTTKINPNLQRVLLIERDEGTRRALSWCIKQQACLAEAMCDTAESFARALTSHKPHAVLLNRNLAGRLGLHSAGQIAVFGQGALVLTYSVYSEGNHMFVSTPGGAESYLLKRVVPEHLLDPILKMDGRTEVTNENLTLHIRSHFEGMQQAHHHPDDPGLAKLTRREREVLALLSKGRVDKEIAQALGISAWTVHGHIKNIFERLKVRTRTEAVVRYLEK
ncbi:MAG: LuxR C-terminal-related transcriptional regulator [Limisphaerales bacterium]